eukprot:Nk52_evm6s391 gene=Nk52_evmTU6s391
MNGSEGESILSDFASFVAKEKKICTRKRNPLSELKGPNDCASDHGLIKKASGSGCVDSLSKKGKRCNLNHDGKESSHPQHVDGTESTKKDETDLTESRKKNPDSKRTDGKGKSSARLLQRFIKLMDTHEKPVTFILDETAETLCVKARRLYDIVNVLTAIGLVCKTEPKTYIWFGKEELPTKLEELC